MTNHLLPMTIKDITTKETLDKIISWEITNKKASELLKLCTRQIIRKKQRYKKEWIEWVIHKARWKPSNNRNMNISSEIYNEIIHLKQEKYSDYNIIHFSEKLLEKHNIEIKYWSLRNILINEKIHKVKKNEITKQYEKRPRKEYEWEMVQYDGSYHPWFEDRNDWKEVCLLVKIDDATGKINAKFDASEWLSPTFNFWKEDIQKYGKPRSIYLDKFATYKINIPTATDDKDLPTQFWRACKDLWITLIFANSPQAKWRVERMNETLQDRLVKELREANISDIETANIFLEEVFLPKFNKQFSVEAKQKWNLCIPLGKEEKEHLDQIFSEHKTRKVRNDFTVAFENNYYQLYRNKNWRWVIVYKWDIITVEKHLDWNIYFSKKGKYITAKKLEEKRKRAYKLPLAPATDIHYEEMKSKIEYLEKIDTIRKENEKQEKQKQSKQKEFQSKTYFETHKKSHPWMKNFKLWNANKILK